MPYIMLLLSLSLKIPTYESFDTNLLFSKFKGQFCKLPIQFMFLSITFTAPHVAYMRAILVTLIATPDFD